jgi:hypothetical protein
MFWITVSIVMAGSLSGFLAGSSLQATGGSLSSMVGGVIVGILAGVSQSKDIDAVQISEIGKLFFLFQISLLGAYLLSNVLRKKGYFKWFMG